MSKIGLSTYAYHWHLSPRTEVTYTLPDVLHSAHDLGVEVVQICDQPPLETASDGELDDLLRLAEQLGLELEVGTRGIRPDQLGRFLAIAERLGARMVRSMVGSGGRTPGPADAVALLRESIPAYEAAGVTLALETYEQIPTAELVSVVTQVGSPALGVCSDPSNTIAILERPRDVVELVAPHVKNMHVKDFAFHRRQDGVGFELVGAALGTGLLDYEHMRAAIDPGAGGINQIIEQWLPWQGSESATLEAETEWNRTAVEYLTTRHETKASNR